MKLNKEKLREKRNGELEIFCEKNVEVSAVKNKIKGVFQCKIL